MGPVRQVSRKKKKKKVLRATGRKCTSGPTRLGSGFRFGSACGSQAGLIGWLQKRLARLQVAGRLSLGSLGQKWPTRSWTSPLPPSPSSDIFESPGVDFHSDNDSFFLRVFLEGSDNDSWTITVCIVRF